MSLCVDRCPKVHSLVAHLETNQVTSRSYIHSLLSLNLSPPYSRKLTACEIGRSAWKLPSRATVNEQDWTCHFVHNNQSMTGLRTDMRNQTFGLDWASRQTSHATPAARCCARSATSARRQPFALQTHDLTAHRPSCYCTTNVDQ